MPSSPSSILALLADQVQRRPDARVEAVEGAGHSVQGDQPLVLARLLDQFADS